MVKLTAKEALRLSIYGGLTYLIGFVLLDKYVFYLANYGLDYWGLFLAGFLIMIIGGVFFFLFAIIHLMIVKKYLIRGIVAIIIAVFFALASLYGSLNPNILPPYDIAGALTATVSLSTLFVVIVYYSLYRHSSSRILYAVIMNIIALFTSFIPLLGQILDIAALAMIYKGVS